MTGLAVVGAGTVLLRGLNGPSNPGADTVMSEDGHITARSDRRGAIGGGRTSGHD